MLKYGTIKTVIYLLFFFLSYNELFLLRKNVHDE